MRTRRRLLWCLSLLGAFAAMTATAFGATTSWGTAIGVPGLENTAEDQVSSISCPRAGNCAAAGFFRTGPSFVVNEKDGVWGTAISVPYGSGRGNYLGSISCATAGSCAAGGTSDDNEHSHAFLVNKRRGVWQKAFEVPGMTPLAHGNNSSLASISCPEPGFCAAGGYYKDSSSNQHAFVVNERDRVWHKAIEVPGLTALGSSGSVTSVSCSEAGSCAAGGTYTDAHDLDQAFVVNQKHGVWGKAIEVPGLTALGSSGLLTSISCIRAGSCAAGGTYTDAHDVDQAFVVNEKHGVWGKAIEVPGLEALNLGGGARLYSISCASVSSCAASGSYTDGSAHVQAFVASEKNGIWRKAIEVPGLAALNVGGRAEAFSVSCAKAGFCGAGGSYMDGAGGFSQQAFVVSETNGVWNTAVEVPGSAALNTAADAGVNAVSCGGAGSCVAGGFYVGDFHATQSFVTAP